MFADLPLLSLVIWVPIIGGALVLFFSKDEQATTARWLSLVVSVATFVLTIPLYTSFDTTTYQMQFAELKPWIPAFNINYHLGIDGISMPLILLTSFSTVLVVIAARSARPSVLSASSWNRVCRAGCRIVLCVLGSHAYSHVPDHRYLGRGAQDLRHYKVLPVYFFRLSVHAGVHYLYVR